MTEERKQRSQAEVDALGVKGQAYKNSDGHYSYPIEIAADVANAVQAYGRAADGEQAGLKAFIIKRAKALGASDQIPDGWSSPSSRSQKLRERMVEKLPPEHRSVSVNDVEVRGVNDDGATILTGTPIVYDTPYTVNDPRRGPFRETVQRGAASRLLNSDVVLAWNHDTESIPLARTGDGTKPGTLLLNDAADGLHFEARLDTANNPKARELASAVERGDVRQMSIGFSVAKDDWSGSGQTRSRSISRFGSLIDISAVTWPASPSTSVSVMQRAATDLDQIVVELRSGRLPCADDDNALATVLQSVRDALTIIVEARNGKVLSNDNQDALKTALQSVHDVLASNGFDAQAFLSGEDDNADEDVDEESDEAEEAGEDRSNPPSPKDDETVEEAALSSDAPMLELELELMQVQARAAHAR